jgi:hypothetical protein
MRQERKLRLQGGLVWLALMTILTIVISAATNTNHARSDLENDDWKSYPEFRLTGFRYYLRKHTRLQNHDSQKKLGGQHWVDSRQSTSTDPDGSNRPEVAVSWLQRLSYFIVFEHVGFENYSRRPSVITRPICRYVWNSKTETRKNSSNR